MSNDPRFKVNKPGEALPPGASINEPPRPAAAPAKPKPPQAAAKVQPPAPPPLDPLPSEAELERMTRAELDALAAERGVDISSANNKHDVIELLRKDARKRR